MLTLVVTEQTLGRLLLEQDDPDCLAQLRSAYDLAAWIGDTRGQARCANHLGAAYQTVSGVRDLEESQRWHQRDLALTPEHDRIGRAATHGSLANVAAERFRDARKKGTPAEELTHFLEAARDGHLQVLALLPPDYHDYRAIAHNQLGSVYREFRDVPRALGHYQQALRHEEAHRDAHGAGETRFNIALLLADNARADDACTMRAPP